ncbi:hypothetical protein NLG97_g1749 [Lecanicillium saksenae]|uniref:Uncharacterized protein n=1 Tax=Lecanicillium saksenae TaxID=468837 RepID=A0ACC1R337_9HYPO|nr:hypothetical protein NLG97_g1749 [Lecanicillium saksenae]
MDKRGIKVTRTSSLWETEPMYVTDQDRFLNGVAEVETELPPMALLDQLQSIEKDLGRRKLIDKGPRNIDLDILLYGDERISNERLNVPHIGIPEREFVLRPLSELIPSKSIDPSKPWKLVQDYLNDLPLGEPLTSVTRISTTAEPLTPMTSNRKSQLMAILNLTPDSFSDGGKHAATDLSSTVLAMVRSGATIIDVGGQSTAPGRPEVTADEESARVLPAVELIRSIPECKDVAISIDTYRASVAEQAVQRGADIINDVSAGTLDADMLPTVGRIGATICLMHMRGTPRTMNQLTDYPEGVVPTVAAELLARVAAAEAAGIRVLAHQADILVNCVYLGAHRVPPFTTIEKLSTPERRLRVICDVSCDPNSENNPIPVYSGYSSFDSPTVAPKAQLEGPELRIIAIDHLPTMIAREASDEYSGLLLPSLLELKDRNTAGVWTRAEKTFRDRVAELP